jgi:hypothetical protein
MGKEGKSLSVSWREQSEPLSLPSVIIYRYFFYRQWASCVQFLCACAKEPRYFPDRGIGRSTDCELTRALQVYVVRGLFLVNKPKEASTCREIPGNRNSKISNFGGSPGGRGGGARQKKQPLIKSRVTPAQSPEPQRAPSIREN